MPGMKLNPSVLIMTEDSIPYKDNNGYGETEARDEGDCGEV